MVFNTILFSNPNNFFTPYIFSYIFLICGILIALLHKFNPKLDIKKFLYIALFFRYGIIAVQIICYLWGSFYNSVNEVVYYGELAKMLLASDYPTPFREYQYGIPPGFQFWLILNFFGYIYYLDGFWSNIVLSIINMILELLTMYIIYKIGKMKEIDEYLDLKDNKKEDMLKYGLLFFSFSIVNIYFHNVRNFSDPFPILLALIGFYFYFKKNDTLAVIFLSISTIIKLNAIFWLLIILLQYLKKREYKKVIKQIIIIGGIVSGFFFCSSILLKTGFFTYLLRFFPSLNAWVKHCSSVIALNQAFSFQIFGENAYLIIYIAITFLIFFIIFKGKEGIKITTFTMPLAIYFIFQPWYDHKYFLWLLPLLCFDLLGSKRRFQIINILIFFSTYLYMFFIQFIYDIPNVGEIGFSDPFPEGLIYRLASHTISYGVLIYIAGLEFWKQFGVSRPIAM